jgi:hypothetical protein
MSGGRAAAPQQPGNADDIVAQVAAASDNLQDLGLDDMQEPVDDDEEYVDEATGKKKQRSWLGKLGKGISKRAAAVKSAIAGAQMTQEVQDALAAVMACGASERQAGRARRRDERTMLDAEKAHAAGRAPGLGAGMQHVSPLPEIGMKSDGEHSGVPGAAAGVSAGSRPRVSCPMSLNDHEAAGGYDTPSGSYATPASFPQVRRAGEPVSPCGQSAPRALRRPFAVRRLPLPLPRREAPLLLGM